MNQLTPKVPSRLLLTILPAPRGATQPQQGKKKRLNRGGEVPDEGTKLKLKQGKLMWHSLQTPPCPGAGSSFRSLRCPGGPDSVKERGRGNLWETEDSHTLTQQEAVQGLAGVAGVGAASRALLSPCSNELRAPAPQTSGTTLGAHSPQPRRPSSCKADPLVIFCHRLHIRCFPVASANSLCKAAFIYRKLQPRRLALK